MQEFSCTRKVPTPRIGRIKVCGSGAGRAALAPASGPSDALETRRVVRQPPHAVGGPRVVLALEPKFAPPAASRTTATGACRPSKNSRDGPTRAPPPAGSSTRPQARRRSTRSSGRRRSWAIGPPRPRPRRRRGRSSRTSTRATCTRATSSARRSFARFAPGR